MDPDVIPITFVLLGVCGGVVLTFGQLVGRTWYPRVLEQWGRRPSVRIRFVVLPGRELREGPAVAEALGRLYVRQIQTIFVGCACIGVSRLLILHGPHLSQSTANSWAVAAFAVAGPLVAVLMLREFTRPYRGAHGGPRAVTAEDYVWPVVRAMAWFAASAAVLMPIMFVVLAAGTSYDADKVFWEGVTLTPLCGAAVVLVAERRLRGITDLAEPDDATLYVWDCLRGRAARLLFGFAFGALVIAFNTAVAVLNGVSQVGAEPAWLARVSTLCWLLEVLSSIGLLLAILPMPPRFRLRLWSTLPPTESVEFGRALPIP